MGAIPALASPLCLRCACATCASLGVYLLCSSWCLHNPCTLFHALPLSLLALLAVPLCLRYAAHAHAKPTLPLCLRYLHCLNACATCAKLVLALPALPLRLATCTTPVPTLLVLALCMHYLRMLPPPMPMPALLGLCYLRFPCACAFPVPALLALLLHLRYLHCPGACATCLALPTMPLSVHCPCACNICATLMAALSALPLRLLQ